KCEYLKNRLNRCKQLVKSITVETRELVPDKRAPWNEKAKGFDATIAKLQQDINWVVTSTERDPSGAHKQVKGIDEMTAKEMTHAAMDIQGQSLQSTARAKQAIQATIQMGTETMDVLKGQTDQLQGISKNVDEVEGNLKRADKQLRAFLRRMANDRIIMIFIFLIVLGVVGAILVAVFDPNGKITKKIVSAIPSIPGINITNILKKRALLVLTPLPTIHQR
ncbi:hypothetical protein HMI55_006050, partial [Coelomomyces lativittatus]